MKVHSDKRGAADDQVDISGSACSSAGTHRLYCTSCFCISVAEDQL